MFSVRYELDFYAPEDGILHSHRRENLKSFTLLLNDTQSYPRVLRCLRTLSPYSFMQYTDFSVRSSIF
jgi:hypothetical protein